MLKALFFLAWLWSSHAFYWSYDNQIHVKLPDHHGDLCIKIIIHLICYGKHFSFWVAEEFHSGDEHNASFRCLR